jgi:hypothetical protein
MLTIRTNIAFILVAALIVFASHASPAQKSFSNKLSPELHRLSQLETHPRDKSIRVTVFTSEPGNLSRVMQADRQVEVLGRTIVRGRVKVEALDKLAGLPGVEAVAGSLVRERPAGPDPEVTLQFSEYRKKKKSPSEFTEPGRYSWWSTDVIGAPEAWDLGYRGEGVNVAVIDSGVDFAHPDLVQSFARTGGEEGWPICFDGYSMEKYFLEGTTDDTWYVETKAVDSISSFGPNTYRMSLQILRDGQPVNQLYTIQLPFEVEAGDLRYGLHPDSRLTALNGNESVAFVVTRENGNSPGEKFNRLYADLNGNYDFRDDTPCDITSPVCAHANPGDDLNDVSGGMVYFIADGESVIPGSDWLYDATAPENGALVAFMLDAEEHGTLSSSVIASAGLINGDPPSLKQESGPGRGMVPGVAPKSRIMALGNYYAGGIKNDFFLFAVLGPDGLPDTGDEAQIVNTSFGNGSVDNDAWDFNSRFKDWLMYSVAPNTIWVNSVGNGGPGYGTVNSPGPSLGVHVGASTQYGANDFFDSIQTVDQILSGDVSSFSCAGPQADGRLGPMVLANGAWGTGCFPLNQLSGQSLAQDGNLAWKIWGGTSRSAPEASGVLALIYDAYKKQHGTWPEVKTARRILMNSANDVDYDVLRQGAGLVDAGRAVRLASGREGFGVEPAFWVAGDYRGTGYESYASLVKRGETWSQNFVVDFPAGVTSPLVIKDNQLIEIGSTDFSINTIATNKEERSFSKPDYLVQLQGPGVNNIPEGTDLAVFEAIFPFDVFDTDFQNGNPDTVTPGFENRYRLLVYNWTDRDGDGKLYDDSLGQAPGLVEASEIDTGEYLRFNYGYQNGTSLHAFVRRPLERMHDGIWIGLRHNTGPSAGTATEVKIRVRYFKKQDCPWLSTSVLPGAVTGQSMVRATIQVPVDMALGVHTARIEIQDASRPEWKTVAPVVMNVAGQLPGGAVEVGADEEVLTYYSNSHVRGGFDWEGDKEAGDTRLFFVDVDGAPAGSRFYIDTEWSDELPTDIDVLLHGPAGDRFTTVGDEYYHPEFGPNTLEWIAGNRGAGNRPTWTFRTFTGVNREITRADMNDGLHQVLYHNVLFSGDRFAPLFSSKIALLNMQPSPLAFSPPDSDFTGEVTITSGLPMDDMRVVAWGPSPWQTDLGLPISGDDPDDPGTASWTRDLNISNAGYLRFEISSDEPDLDLYLYQDGFGGGALDGVFSYPQEVVIRSRSNDSNEFVFVSRPLSGLYRVAVHGYSVSEGGGVFSLRSLVVQGRQVDVSPPEPRNLPAGTPYTLSLGMDLPERRDYAVYLTFGPSEIPNAVDALIPVSRILAGDVDRSGVLDYRDMLDVSRYWMQPSAAPAEADFDRNGKFDQDDLIEFIEVMR